jgi:hypothetical protein
MLQPRHDNFKGAEAAAANVPLADESGFARLGFNARSISFFWIAILCAASVWFYADQILVARQVKDAAAYARPRGNLSDLYPRWVGARELLLNHRNPYFDDVTVEIQKGYYGRAIDPARPNDPKDREGFAYPVYVVFLLAPLMWWPFHDVQLFFYWLLVSATAGSAWLWLRTLRWSLSWLAILATIGLVLGNLPAVQGIKIQQLSLLVAGLIALAVASISKGHLFAGGVLMALTTIKPQLAWEPVAVLLLWAISDWRKRKGFAIGFAATMALLLIGAEIVLPGWWRFFAEAVRQYHQYTGNQSVVEVTLSEVFGAERKDNLAHLSALLLSMAVVIACGVVLWRFRKVKAEGSNFGHAMALVLALTVVVVPMYAPYNQVLLLPAIFVLLKERKEFVSRMRWRRLGFGIGVVVVVWQWVASVSLVFVYYLISRDRALQGWTWPLFGTFAFPLWIFGLIFIHVRTKRPTYFQLDPGAS